MGAYLPIGTTLPIFVGGVVRWLVDKAVKKAGGDEAEAESDISPGSLFASGLIAAGGIVGLIGVALKAMEATYFENRDLLNLPHTFLYNDFVSRCRLCRAGVFALLFRAQTAQKVDRSKSIRQRALCFRHPGSAFQPG